MKAHEVHNALAGDLVKRIVRETACGVDAVIVAESVVLGVLIAQAGTRETALDWLSALIERVEERLPSDMLVPFDVVRHEGGAALQ